MARDTQTQLRNEMIYSVFVRNYSEAGNFAGVTADLQRIKDLGTDILWLLPINPIGEVTLMMMGIGSLLAMVIGLIHFDVTIELTVQSLSLAFVVLWVYLKTKFKDPEVDQTMLL